MNQYIGKKSQQYKHTDESFNLTSMEQTKSEVTEFKTLFSDKARNFIKVNKLAGSHVWPIKSTSGTADENHFLTLPSQDCFAPRPRGLPYIRSYEQMECLLHLLAHRNRGVSPPRWNYSRSLALLLMAVAAECP